ncbi:MAG: hypothetical protein IKC11_03790 [Clostridia bacterium]|nr:hypothetical protein [Clostridia bacterium]
MNGGSIKNKTAENGGAVYISSGATFTMNGGTISGNTATKGSGVYVASGGTFNMNGGTMANDVYALGGMVYGGGTVSGNITLDGAERLTINKTPDSPLKVTALTTAVGTKLAKVNASDFEISDITVSGLPTGRRAVVSGDYVVVDYTYHTITINVNNSAYGTVSKTSISVPYGSSISASGATLTVGSQTITATPTTDTAQYDYSFSSWTGASGTVTENKTITANFTRTVNKYTVTLGSSSYGSWDTATAITVDYGTSISVSSNKLTVGSTTRTFTASADTAQYDYTFNSLSGVPSGGKVIANVTITPSVTRTTKSYTLSYSNGYYYANTATDVTVTVSGGTLSKSTINNTNTTFTLTAEYSTSPITITFTRKNTNRNYMVWWSGSQGAENTVSRTWTPTANESNSWYLREYFTVTARAGTGISGASFSGTGCWGETISATTSAKLLYGASLKFSATVSTGYTWSKWSDGNTTQTNYAVTTSLNKDIDLTASATINKYTVTWKNYDGTTLETDTNVTHGTTPTYNGSTPTKPADDNYHYTFKGWSPAVAGITGNTTYTAEFNSVGHTWETIERYTGDTCQEDGGCKQKCSVCSRTRTLSTGGYYGEHVYEYYRESESYAPTCEEWGLDYWECNWCSEYITEDLEPIGHNYNQTDSWSGSDCVTEGQNEYTCDNCGDSYTEGNGDYGEHDYELTDSSSGADCETEGESEYTCSLCGDSFVVGNGVYGDHDYECVESTTGDDCQTAGTDTYQCSICGDEYSEDNDNYGDHDYECIERYTGDTCQEEGGSVEECTICSDTVELETGGYYGDHVYDYYRESESYAPTCEEWGLDYWECNWCYDYVTYDLEPTGHDYELRNSSAGTDCQTSGVDEYECNNCGATYNEDNDWYGSCDYEYDSSIDGTCIQEGRDVFVCTVCGDSFTVGNGEYGECNFSRVSDHQDATCEEWGYTVWYCEYCGTEDTSDYPPIGHDYECESTEGIDCLSTGVDTYTCTICGDSYWEKNNDFGPCDMELVGNTYICSVCGRGYIAFAPGSNSIFSNDGEIQIKSSMPVLYKKETAYIDESQKDKNPSKE